MLQQFAARHENAIALVKNHFMPAIQRAKEGAVRESLSEMPPLAFFFRKQMKDDNEHVSRCPLQDNMQIRTRMIELIAEDVDAWAVLHVVDGDCWQLRPNAHETVGMDLETFRARTTSDPQWLFAIHDRVSRQIGAISFQFESLIGSWDCVLAYERHEKHGLIWHPPTQGGWKSGLIFGDDRFAPQMLPAQTGWGVARA
jgi:hypothetical protein